MTRLDLVMAPDPVFRQKAKTVQQFDDRLKTTVKDMLELMYERRGIGMGANMVGLLERIIVIDLQEDGERSPLVCINPVILSKSETTIEREEASLCFPGIKAAVKRPDAVEIAYQDTDGNKHTLKAEGWLATVIQHEMDYLEGRTFLDHLSKLKRDRLMKKMVKETKQPQNSCCSDPSCSNNQ